MAGGGGHAPPPPAENGGEFLLSLLQRPNHRPQTPQQPLLPPQFQLSPQLTPFTSPPPPQPLQNPHLHNLLPPHQSYLALDPAVAAVGPSIALFQSNGLDLLSPPPWPHNHSTSPLPSGFLPWSSPVPQFQGSQTLGFSNHDIFQPKQQLEHKLQFGSFPSNIQSPESLLAGNSNLNTTKEREVGLGIGNFNGFERNSQFNPKANPSLRIVDVRERDRKGGGGEGGNHRAPPGFSNKSRGGGNWDHGSRRRELDHIVGKEKGNPTELNIKNSISSGQDRRTKNGNGSAKIGLTGQLDRPGPLAGSNLHSVSAVNVDEALFNFDADVVDNGKDDGHELDELGGELADSLLLEGDGSKRLDGESNSKRDKKQSRHPRKESRSDNRGKYILSQRMRMMKRQLECRRDIDRLNSPFLAIYESLIPPEEEKAKQKQLLTLLEKLVQKEWPEARLYLYGSCANSFGVLKSDIDVCLAIGDVDIKKSEVLLKLADILQSDNLQNVQALTRARVPIVKLTDPVTGISCDICINNVLAVVNTKLLRDYAQIDERLRQLAFIVKHWAKSRGVNETYQGTLSSYAYVLMCIHFLQLRRPAILPCLQEMETTYSVTIDDIECSYFDQVEKLSGFGSRNKETIGHLVWAFFNYWAYRHDYVNDVISVRTGSIISKHEKDWTRRIENDRHLICMEDPFLISHDLGRVVDKYSIRVLREEFERAADIMQYDPNPCVTLFELYVPS